MKNLSLKEKVLMFVVVIVVGLLALYLLVIKPLNQASSDLKLQQITLQQTVAYYDSLKDENSDTSNQIQVLNDSISSIELDFLPELNTESIVQYVMNVFETNGCPYLSSVETSSVACNDVALPDGTFASDRMVVRRVTVTYSTTDGYCVPQYNGTPEYNTSEDLAAAFEAMGTYGMSPEEIIGYSQFVTSLEEIERANPSCIKISRIHVEDQLNGFMLLTADIDFYATSLVDRVSVPQVGLPYVDWSGATDVDCAGGQIGIPLIVDNPASSWDGISLIVSESGWVDRPFATYFSSALFSLLGGMYFDEDDVPTAPEAAEAYINSAAATVTE